MILVAVLWHLNMSQWYLQKITIYIIVTSWGAAIRNDSMYAMAQYLYI